MEPGESVEGLVMATGADSILFMDFIKLLDQEPLRSGLPEVAKGEVPPTLPVMLSTQGC